MSQSHPTENSKGTVFLDIAPLPVGPLERIAATTAKFVVASALTIFSFSELSSELRQYLRSRKVYHYHG